MHFPKTGSGKRLITRGLFIETCEDPTAARYTLKDDDTDGMVSLRRLYLEQDDPSEYHFAVNVIGSLAQWEELCKCKWFQPLLTAWRRELDLRIKAGALVRLREEAASGSRNSFQANRYLLEKGWESKETRRGRPSKAEIHAETVRQAQADKQIESDYERLAQPVTAH